MNAQGDQRGDEDACAEERASLELAEVLAEHEGSFAVA
jgi:hypothetical protein